DGFFTVGDVGYLDEEGYLFLCDRKTDMIISGGVNIYPAEVESVLLTHPAVADAAVFGIPDDDCGEQVKAVIEPAPGAEPGAALAEIRCRVSYLAETRNHLLGEEVHRAHEELVRHAARPHPEKQALDAGFPEPRHLLRAAGGIVEEEHVLEPVLVGVLRQPSA